MNYVVQWHIPKRAMLLKVSGDVGVEDLQALNSELIHYLQEGIAPVHLISVGSNIGHVPTNLMKIQQSVSFVQHPKLGWTVIVQEVSNPLIVFLVKVAMQASGTKVKYVKNIQTSEETLMRLDQSLAQIVRSA